MTAWTFRTSSSSHMVDAQLPVRAVFTDRAGGVSVEPYDTFNLSAAVGDDPRAVGTNRDALAASMDGPVIFMRPEHGSTVVRVDASFASCDELPVGDVLVTTTPGIAVAALAGDCVPLLMHDAASGAVVAAHVGRKGLVAGAVDASVGALDALRRDASDRTGVTAAIGPSICGRCYEVPEEMAADVVAAHPAARAVTQWGTAGLDVGAAVAARLRAHGIALAHHDTRCTYEDARLFSFRRDGVTGRHGGVIRCEGPPS